MITDAIFENKDINKIINKKNDNGKTALEEMVAEIVLSGDTVGNFNENHRKYLAKKLSDVPGLVIPKPPKKGRGVNAAIELINIANKKATYVARDMKPIKSASAVKTAVTSNDSKGSKDSKGSRRSSKGSKGSRRSSKGKGSKDSKGSRRSLSIPSFEGPF